MKNLPSRKDKKNEETYQNSKPESIGPLILDNTWKGNSSSMFKAQSRDRANKCATNQLLQTPGTGKYTPNVDFVL